MGKTIAISNQKGGVGKTTTSVNLADALSRLNQRVLLIDMDPQASATISLGLNQGLLKATIYQILTEDVSVLESAIKPKEYLFDVIASSAELTHIELKIDASDRELLLYNKLAEIKDNYDYILIDCPPSLGLLTHLALFAADSVLIPVQCQFLAIDSLTQLLNTIRIIQKKQKDQNRNLSIEGVLLTMLDKRIKASWEIVHEVKSYFKDGVFNTIISYNVAAQVAPIYGMSVLKYAPKSPASKLYKALAIEILENQIKI